MPRQTVPPPLQLGLDLRRSETDPPITEEPTALLQTLADLLLGALGVKVEEAGHETKATGGGDESEDHV